MQSGGVGTLRTLNITGGALTTRMIADIPVRIESIDIGDIYVGQKSIAAGLARHYEGTSGAVRVFTYDNLAENWSEESFGQSIVNNVEAIAIGDADNDGNADVIAGLEGYYPGEIRLRSYTRGVAGWNEELISNPEYQGDVQMIQIADLYATGQNSVVVAVANTGLNRSASMEIRAFTKSLTGWNSELIATNIGGQLRAERMLLANLDSDPELEIVVGAWNGYNPQIGSLFALDHSITGWQLSTIGASIGAVDGLGVGPLTGPNQQDLIVSTRSNVLLYRRDGSTWTQQLLSYHPYASFIWDADMGNYDNDGVLGGIAAVDSELVRIKPISGGGFQTSIIATMPRLIDSAQVADVDQRTFTCPSESTPE